MKLCNDQCICIIYNQSDHIHNILLMLYFIRYMYTEVMFSNSTDVASSIKLH